MLALLCRNLDYKPQSISTINNIIGNNNIGKISALIEESPTSNIAIVGDFNAAIDTQFDVELQELCNNLSLVISDCNYYDRNSGMFTHVSDAHGTTSWLDHVLCSQDMQTKLHSIAILDMLPSSDHVE